MNATIYFIIGMMTTLFLVGVYVAYKQYKKEVNRIRKEEEIKKWFEENVVDDYEIL